MKKLFIYLTVILTISSCMDDFLDRGSLTQLAEGNFWLTEADAQLGINGVYAALQSRALYSGNLNGNAGIPQYDGLSDNVFNSFKWEGPGIFMEANVDPATPFFNSFWTANYVGIGRANAAISNISNISPDNISEESKGVLLGQAYFLRALFYMNLAVYFEEAPLILEVQTLETAYVPKNSYNEIKLAIEEDLAKAIQTLPNSYPGSQFGYATKGAALSLAARWALYNKEYQKVVEFTNETLGLGYGLHNNYGQLFTEAGELSNEIVFSIRFIIDQSNNTETFSGTFLGAPKVDDSPMANLVDDYYCIDGLPISESPLYNPQNRKENRDPRLGASIYFPGDIFLVDLNRPFIGNTPTGFGRRKYTRNQASPEGVAVFSPGGQDFYLIRYADVLLMRAEALAELGQLGEVYNLVNQVRVRAGMPVIEDVEGSGLSQGQLIDIVRHERRVELAFESLRFFDLKRWGIMEEAYARAAADPVGPFNPQYRGRRSEVFPIPQQELDANRNLVQNPVWN
ncbi:RagB/SusD family nutrient uptake outer membrane protein [Cecembia rubra]|uniref:Putative outer membrane starch-binding protein n=1 Tax=Cecembia rubra TaxID=1485585 RepID=A0A2P8ECH2_9BACT|nr:RagB/SusD family nutrient uptake outer membrane protein [Cecembia rubra]PSL07154.1 putative outer membrane starch-binding protein [Cecembia rubra]